MRCVYYPFCLANNTMTAIYYFILYIDELSRNISSSLLEIIDTGTSFGIGQSGFLIVQSSSIEMVDG